MVATKNPDWREVSVNDAFNEVAPCVATMHIVWFVPGLVTADSKVAPVIVKLPLLVPGHPLGVASAKVPVNGPLVNVTTILAIGVPAGSPATNPGTLGTLLPRGKPVWSCNAIAWGLPVPPPDPVTVNENGVWASRNAAGPVNTMHEM